MSLCLKAWEEARKGRKMSNKSALPSYTVLYKRGSLVVTQATIETDTFSFTLLSQ